MMNNTRGCIRNLAFFVLDHTENTENCVYISSSVKYSGSVLDLTIYNYWLEPALEGVIWVLSLPIVSLGK